MEDRTKEGSAGRESSRSPVGENGGAWRSRLTRAMQWAAAHPGRVGQGTIVFLIVVVVLQNIESTSIDFLFWSIEGVPKLLVLLVAMILGGGLWEIARRLLSR